MQNVTYIPRRQSVASGLMADLLPMVQQQEQYKQQQALALQKQQADAADLAKKAYLEQFLKASPERQRDIFAGAPPDVKRLLFDPGPPDAAEMAQKGAAQYQADALSAANPEPVAGQSMSAPPSSLISGGGGTYPTSGADRNPSGDYAGSGAKLPDRVAPDVSQKLNAWFTQYAINNHRAPSKDEIDTQLTALTSGGQGLAQRSAINDKRALSAEEETKVPLTQAQTQETLANVPLRGAQAAQARASAAKDYAEIGKLKEETTGLRGTNALMSGAASGSSASGTPTVPLDKAPAIVRMLVNRTYDPAMMRRFKPEQQEALLQSASQYDPKLNLQDYPEQFAIKKDFASGAAKKNVQSLNTAIGHTYDMWAASKKIDNFNGIPLVNTWVNATVNKAKVGSGRGTPIIEYNDAATGATQELATLFKGGVGTEGEVHEWRSNVSPNMSKEQRDASIQQLAHMIGARTEALASNYERTGRSFFDDQLNAKSKTLLTRMGIDPHTFEITGPGPVSGAPASTGSGGLLTLEQALAKLKLKGGG